MKVANTVIEKDLGVPLTKVTPANAAAAAGAAPDKAEFDAVVTLVNEAKACFNLLVDELVRREITTKP